MNYRLLPQILILSFITTITCFSYNSSRDEKDTTGNVRWFTGSIIDRVTIRPYYFGSNYPSERYTLINSDGDVLNRGVTVFTEFAGHGSILGALSYDYRFQNKDIDGLYLKEGSVKITRWGMSLEYGRGNSWIGHGYSGSLLLSNNAEPYEMITFQTVRPFGIPYLGRFEYKMVHGWIDEHPDLLAQRVTYRPVPWLEFGANQVVRYRRAFKWYDFFRIMTAKHANIRAGEGEDDERDISVFTDMIASIDIAVRFGLPGNLLYPVTGGGMFFEYGGEDLTAFWQEESPWIGPLGFEFLQKGTMAGFWLTTGSEEFRIEYAQNFRQHHLLSRYAYRLGSGKYTVQWYGQGATRYYLNEGNILGHHMGNTADNLYMHIKRRGDDEEFRIFYSLIRRDLVHHRRPDYVRSEYPETFQNIGLEYRRTFGNIAVTSILEWHRFENVDQDPHPLRYDILPRSTANQFLIGLELSYLLSDNAIATGPADFSWLEIEPVTRLRFRGYYLKTDHPSGTYNLINAAGDKLESALSPFWNIEGRATAFDNITLDYNFQADFSNRLKLKQASLRYTVGKTAFSVGRGSVWLGHGYYGSLLLSNHSEPFPLVRFEIVEPVEVPYIGSVRYTIFNGYPKNFNLVGHRVTWFPHRLVEIGGNKIVAYTDGVFPPGVPAVLFQDASLDRDGHRRDSRMSIDVALHLPFLRDYFYPLVDGKIYFEYAGEEQESFWTTKGGRWVGPFGFEFIGVGNIMGVWLATERYDFRLEYAQNYRNDYLFNSAAENHLWGSFSLPWYGAYGPIPYLNGGSVMGHHMGSHADAVFAQFQYFLEESTVKIFYSNRRRGLVERQPPQRLSAFPEEKTQYGIEVSHTIWNFTLTGLIKWNRYVNVDQNPDPLIVNTLPGTEEDEFIIGFTVDYRLGR